MHVFRGILGIVVLLALMTALSQDRRAINWRLVAGGVLLQVALAAAFFTTDATALVMEPVAAFFVKITEFSAEGARMGFRCGAAWTGVRRLPCGGGRTFGSFHSQELESFFLSMPGLKALYPSTPQDAFNALLAAYEDDNPVLLLEHKGLYRRGRAPVAWDPAYRDVWSPRQVRAGDFATLVTYGEMVHVAEEAAAYLQEACQVTLLRCGVTVVSPQQPRTCALAACAGGRECGGGWCSRQ